jgi:hypothetical protein
MVSEQFGKPALDAAAEATQNYGFDKKFILRADKKQRRYPDFQRATGFTKWQFSSSVRLKTFRLEQMNFQ